MMAKPMKTLELHFPMIQFLIKGIILLAVRLRVCKRKAKNLLINILRTSKVRALRENLKSLPCRIDLAFAR